MPGILKFKGMSLNKAMLIGNVGKDPEIRYIEGNAANGSSAGQGDMNSSGGQAWGGATKVASFTLATTERFRDRSGNLRENTEWHNIVAWRGNADITEKYVRKGTQLFVEGRIRTRSWEDQSGNKRYVTEIIADNLQLLGKKSDNPASSDNRSIPAAQVRQSAAPAPEPGNQTSAPSSFAAAEDDDDLPF